jgi:glycine/D-amino acid oxidase-like deaminating enzyme
MASSFTRLPPRPPSTTSNNSHRRAQPPPRLARTRATVSPRSPIVAVDVVIVGAGIIGLWTAYEALRRNASVALIDAQRPVAGGTSSERTSSSPRLPIATGAGQGYLWLAHREAPLPSISSSSPSAASWHLAARGKRRWERLGSSAATDPVAAELARRAQLRRTGSLLLATTADEAASLEARAARLCAAPAGPNEASVRVLATPREVAADEPALAAAQPSSSSSSLVRAALLVESDAQIDGRGAALGLLDACRQLGGGAAGAAAGGRRLFEEALDDAAASICPAPASGGGGGAEVETASGRRFRARAGVVVAGGAWTGALLADALLLQGGGAAEASSSSAAAAAWRAFLAPRRGHLLEVDAATARLPAPLRRGAMELSYSRHYKHAGTGGGGGGGGGGESSNNNDNTGGAAAAATAAPSSSSSGSEVTFTVTSGGNGTLLLGSSREDAAGFDGRADAGVLAAILGRAAEFLPSLRPLAEQARGGGGGGGNGLSGVRVGVRPWAAGGLPAIGPVPGLPGVVVAAGHEGSGLVMAPATAELALQWVGLDRDHHPVVVAAEEDDDDGSDQAWRDDGGRALCAEHLVPERRLLFAPQPR